MGQNADGSARCDRCGTWLAGFGVLYGMVCTDISSTGAVTQRIYCYANNCRSVVLAGLVNQPIATSGQPRCTDCGVPLPERSVEHAMLAADIDPAGSTMRQLTFCYVNQSRERLLAKGVL